MAKRLIKIAKELNVGLSTVVDQLKKDGFEIEERPTAKVSDEMYQSLLVAFEKSIAIKEQADKIVIGNRPSKEQEKEEEAKKVLETKQAHEAAVKAKAEAVAKKEAEVKDAAEAKAEAEAKKETEAKAVKKLEEVAVPKKEEPKSKKEVETPKELKAKEEPKALIKLTGPKVIGKINLDAPKKKKPVKVEKVKKDEKLSIKSKESSKSKPVETIVEQKVSSAKPEPKAVAKKDDEPVIHATSVPKLKGLKVLGKIDTDKLKPKPKKKEKPKPGAKGAAGDPKKKRRRIRRPVAGAANKGNSSSTSRRKPAGKKAPKRPEVKEISQKEIEEKIKATMARIGGGGNKKKRQKLRREKRDHRREVQEQLVENLDTSRIELTEFISVNELSSLLDVSITQVITTCMNLGVIVSINQRLDAEIIELVAEEFGREVDFISAESQLDEEVTWEDAEEDLMPRSPIVTVMGHVDHGKTSLLDFIRNANVASGEAGGITQHIGSYVVEVGENNKKITFLDTPGHEAFTAMRARGAKVTDIAIIIIAADDNIMPQTKEAISHAQAAGVPIVFAINKIDKPGASPDRIKNELAEMNLMVEEWGGKYQSQDISAKEGTNIDLLLEKVILETDMLELKANPNRPAIGATLDASLDKGRGYVTKALIQTGTLKIGDPVYAGEYSGKVKAMFDENGQRMKEAGPSQPVLILGLNGAPQAGEYVKVATSEQDAKSIASKRAHLNREQANRASKRISLDEIGRRLALGTFKELNLIIKGDVDGSVEALSDSLIKLSVETIQVNVIHKAVGQIIESDVLLASASDAIIIGFQVRPSGLARKLAEKEGVEVKTYSIIYKAIEEIKMAMEGMLEPTKEESVLGQVEIRETYKISKVGTIAGCFVTDGIILRNSFIRLIREGIVVYPIKEGQQGEISSLKRYKDDVKEARAGMECGLSIKNFNDIKVGDIVEAYEIKEIKQTLD